jgi:hypothetical protein
MATDRAQSIWLTTPTTFIRRSRRERERVRVGDLRRNEISGWVFAGYSRTFPGGIRGYSVVFAGIRGHLCAIPLPSVLAACRNYYA